MTALVWDDRSYEAGVDRGVLYIPVWSMSGTVYEGVAWNGLISVEEAPVSGDIESRYLDGINFSNIARGRYYQARVTALSAPQEFSDFNGDKLVVPGFHLTQQPKARFGFSYRVQTDAGYNIHIVYNCLATAEGRTDETISSDVSPTELSWTFDATPVSVSYNKPTAHFIFQSETLAPERLTLLENKLYGEAATTPVLPTITEIKTLFGI